MKKSDLLKKYNLNFSRIFILLQKFGLNKKIFLNINDLSFLSDFNQYLLMNLEKKDFILKNNYLLSLQKIDIGLYRGYKYIRGLPLNNQRTKTNSKTSRKKLN